MARLGVLVAIIEKMFMPSLWGTWYFNHRLQNNLSMIEAYKPDIIPNVTNKNIGFRMKAVDKNPAKATSPPIIWLTLLPNLLMIGAINVPEMNDIIIVIIIIIIARKNPEKLKLE